MNVVAPNVANLTRGGAIIMLAIAAMAPGYLDIGNIPEFSYSTPTQFVEHKTSRSGKILMDRREPTEFAMSFKISSDEMNAANMALIFNSTAASAFSQAAGTITLTLATPVLGATYPSGDFRIDNVVVKVSGVTKTLGVDYALEADGGAIRILPTGSILHSDTITVTYTRPTGFRRPAVGVSAHDRAIGLHRRYGPGRRRFRQDSGGDHGHAGLQLGQSLRHLDHDPRRVICARAAGR
jgi:hypothetical protein